MGDCYLSQELKWTGLMAGDADADLDWDDHPRI